MEINPLATPPILSSYTQAHVQRYYLLGHLRNDGDLGSFSDLC